MAAIGATSISFRGPGPWGGMTTQSRATPFQHELLDNCYVSSTGTELRPIPGFKTYIDLVGTGSHAPNVQGQGGFYGHVHDARRPVAAAHGNYDHYDGVTTQTMKVWSEPTHLHAFAQVAGKWVLIGEDNYRREPLFDASTGFIECWVTAYAFNGPSNTILTLDKAYKRAASGFNSVDSASAGADPYRITVSGLTGPGAALLNGLAHVVVGYPSTTTIEIDTSLVNAGNNASGQVGAIGRISIAYDSSNTISDDRESLTTWTVPTNGFGATPAQASFTAYVANRHRDFGDGVGTTYEGGALNASRRRQLSIPYRIVPHVAGTRLIMAAPGYGCVFQMPLGIPLRYGSGDPALGLDWIENDIYDKPRCVGVPKATMYVDTQRASAIAGTDTHSAHTVEGAPLANAFGGSGAPQSSRNGIYKFAVAYKDEITGEIGLLSETVTIATGTANASEGIRLYVTFPGYLMHESMALSVNVYRSQRNGETLYFDRTVPMFAEKGMLPVGVSSKYGVTVNTIADNVQHLLAIDVPYTTDTELEKHSSSTVPSIEQMPMGCKAARTVRGGWTVYGGALGNAGAYFELFDGNMSWRYDKNSLTAPRLTPLYPNHDVIYSYSAQKDGTGITTSGRYGCGVRGVPPAYAGQEMFSRVLFAAPRQNVRLNLLINNEVDYNEAQVPPELAGQMREMRYQIVDSPFQEGLDADNTRIGLQTYLRLPRGQIQISEADNPGVTPATNTTVVSKENSEDVEGVGEANGQLVVCTRSKTYFIGYGRSPVGVPGELASDHYGCIGANTMVNFDLGCAWVSDRGPCAIIGGSFQWIGEPIQHLFTGGGARYLRDGTGMMRHAWGAHDAERGLLYFGMFADRANGTSDEYTLTYRGNPRTWDAAGSQDEAKSRWPCDEVLIYSYRVGAWSVWRPPLKLLIQWMTGGIDTAGRQRMFFMGSDRRIYVMDDRFSQWNEDAIVADVTANSAASTTIVTNASLGNTVTNRGNGTFWHAGMEVLVIRPSIQGNPMIKRTTLVSASVGTLVVADAMSVAIGDEVHIGVRSFRMQTNYINLKQLETAKSARTGLRFSLDSRYGNGGSEQHSAYIKTSVVATRIVDGEIELKTVCYTQGETGFDDYSMLAVDGGDGRVIDRSQSLGGLQGVNMRLELEAVGGAGVRLHDLYMEAQ